MIYLFGSRLSQYQVQKLFNEARGYLVSKRMGRVLSLHLRNAPNEHTTMKDGKLLGVVIPLCHDLSLNGYDCGRRGISLYDMAKHKMVSSPGWSWVEDTNRFNKLDTL